MGNVNKGAGKQHNSEYNGPERRSEPRVPRRNIRRAKMLVVVATLTAILGGWLGFATVQPHRDPPPATSAPIGAVAPAASTLSQPLQTEH